MRRQTLALAGLLFSLGVARIFAADAPSLKTVGTVQTRNDRSTRLFIQTHPTGARVDLDGVTLGASDGLFHVAPGLHTITAALAGYRRKHREINIHRNEIGRVVLALEKQSAEGPVEIMPIAVAPPGRSVVVARPDFGEPDFPWGSLAPADEPSAALALKGHRRHVNWVEFSPTGGLLASAGADNAIRLWRVPSGTLRHRLVADESSFGVYCVTFSPDGQTLASCDGTTVQLWDVETGRLRRIADGIGADALGLAFSLDGKTLAVATGEGQLALCDPDSLEVRSERRRPPDIKTILLSHDTSVRQMANSLDGNLLAFAGGWHPRESGRLAVWNARTRTASLISLFQVPGGYVRSVAFSPDGLFLAYTAGNTVKLVPVARLPKPKRRG